VLLCPEAGNLVVAEGGPKGIRKFVRLMTERYVVVAILWSTLADFSDN
jgi:hypothetical protein